MDEGSSGATEQCSGSFGIAALAVYIKKYQK